MNLRSMRRTAVRGLVVAGMTLGVVTTAASVATAQPGNNWYVSTSGTDTGNNCTSSAAPCATIDRALVEQAAANVTGVIHVAAGTYAQQVTAGPGNSNVTIKGAGPSATIIEPPSSGLASDTDTDTSYPQFYVVDVQPGTSGIVIQKLSVNGLNAIPFLDSDGYGCSQDYVGVYFHGSSGSLKKVDVTGIDMPPDEFGCQGGTGIYVNSTEADPSNVTISNDSLTAPQFESVTKATLPAGTYSNEILPVKAEPAGYSGGSVVVGGYVLSATPDGAKNLFISGTTDTSLPSGTTVDYNAYQQAYDKNGIACNDNWTTCNITGSTVVGAGPTNAIGQNGILAWGSASVTIGSATAPNFISGDTFSGGGGSGNAASGILLLNGGTFNVGYNNVSDSDVGIYAGEVQAYGIVYPSPGSWKIRNNTVTGATSTGASAGEDGYGEGIQVDSTTNNVHVFDNTVSGSAQSNILLTGVSNATIGGFGANEGNTVESSALGAGIVVGGPGTECEYAFGNSCSPGAGNPDQFSSTGDTVANNSITANGVGVVVEGQYDPSMVGPADPDAAYSNEFSGNNWSDNAAANVADFSGYGAGTPPSNSYGTPSADACEPSAGGSSYFGANYWAC
jgi:hypothetical protein